MRVRIKKLMPEFYERFDLPAHASEAAAGVDLRAATYGTTKLLPGDKALIPTGLVFEVPQLVAMLLIPRSGLGHKNGIILGNSVGLIDPDYRGEVKVSLWNTSQELFTVAPGDRICQALFMPYFHVRFEEVEDLTETVRGEGGFASTGVN